MNKDMEVDLIYYELKLQSLLEKFLETGYHIKNDVYFNRLLSFLGGKENKELAELLLKLPLMAEWVLRAVKQWEAKRLNPDHSVSAFTIQLLALISKNESIFNDLLKHDLYNKILNVLQVTNTDSLPTIKLAFIKLLTSVVAHPSGQKWLLQTNYWQDILTLSLQSQTVYIRKEGHFFISSFLDAILQYNDSYFTEIWQIIIKPLLTKPEDLFRNHENMFEVCDEQIDKFLGPTLYLINDILEYFFDQCLEGRNAHLRCFKTIISMPQMIESVTNYLHIIRNQNLTYEVGRIWILLLYLSMAVGAKNGVIKPDIDKEFMEPVFSLLTIMSDSVRTTCISKYLYFILIHWYKLNSKIKVDYIIESDDKFTFEDQFLIPQQLPTVLFYEGVCDNILELHDLREEYLNNLLGKLCRTSIRWGYKWRSNLLGINTLLDLGPTAISNALQLKPYYTRDNAVFIFQSLLYSLVDVNALLKNDKHCLAMLVKCEGYLKILLEALAEFIVHFNISWKDSVESLCVFVASVEFLKFPQWSPKLVIADLNLIKVGIARYLSPNFALLIDRQENCAIFILCALLPVKMHDPEWSVRDSALEVLSVIAEASKIEFQSFQQILLRNDLCNLVLTVSLSDGESFVRTSALKCLNHMIQVDAFWKNLESQEVAKKMMLVLKRETEGLVRAQAPILLATIFKYHDMDPLFHKEIYASLSSGVLDDLHWEVRLNSLAFWDDIVEQKLKDQGMVDGEFPQCTFSPESRKIVNLTEAEIKKRIIRVLDQLSEIGCLTVLKHAISDDCDLQVSKRGLEISKKLVDLIEKYKIADSIDFEEKGPPSNDSCYSSVVLSTPSPSMQSRDDIIDQILGATDTSLLKDVYSPGKEYSSNIVSSCRHRVTTSEFLCLTQQNFKSLVSDREKWINSLDSLSSLLNDMLESYEPNDTNAMDCY